MGQRVGPLGAKAFTAREAYQCPHRECGQWHVATPRGVR
jgi:hypothetical protein